MAEFETITYEEDDGVAWVTLNRPEVLNAFNHKMEEELQFTWRAIRSNDDVRVVVLTGAGDRAFCTGIDRDESINPEVQGAAAAAGKRVGFPTPWTYDDPGANICPKGNQLWKPIIAAVNGMACAGAFYLLGEVEFIIAADHATFFDPHVSTGMVAGYETVHLVQKVPLGEALRIALLGVHERLTAARAHQIGLVSEVVPAPELMERALWVASKIAQSPPLAVQGTLRAAWLAHEVTRRDALAQISALTLLGTEQGNLASGQESFRDAPREKPRLR
jgi:enoyl-CoA hydratase/carnithine racemase